MYTLACRSGIIRTFRTHYTWYSLERIVNLMEEDHKKENVMNVWKDYTIEDAIIVREKAVKAIKLQIINSCWRKLCPDAMRDFRRFMTEPIKGMKKEIVATAKKGWGRGWRVSGYRSWRNLRSSRHHTRRIDRRWLDRDECFGTSARQWGRLEEAVPENKLTLANLAEGFRVFYTGCDLYLFIYCLAAPGLHCCMRAFSSWSEQWLPLAAVVGLPLLQALEHGFQYLWP